MRRVIVDALEREGHETYDVGDGASLLVELARNDRFHYDAVDAVVADVRMPLCSGLQALETIRTVRSNLPFVLLTAFGDGEMHARAERLGAKMLDKPVSMEELVSVVNDVVAARRGV